MWCLDGSIGVGVCPIYYHSVITVLCSKKFLGNLDCGGSLCKGDNGGCDIVDENYGNFLLRLRL